MKAIVCRQHAKIVKRHGAAVVVMAFDEDGQAANFDEKVRPRSRFQRVRRSHLGCNPIC